jgi:ABC-type lipoprotein release transport system permease subunit
VEEIGASLVRSIPEGKVIIELDIISEMAKEAVRAWSDALLPGQRAQLAAGDALKDEARDAVFDAAVKDLETELQKAVSRPLQARIQTWEEQKPILTQAVEREKWIVGFLIFLLDVFIGCVVLLMLVLMVIEKTRDIGILLALGAHPRGVVSIFLVDGLAIVAVGVVLGLVAGYFFVDNINALHDGIHALTGIRLFDPEIYHLDRIPMSVSATQVLASIFPPIIFGFLASLIPAVWASRQDPIKAIHYE